MIDVVTLHENDNVATARYQLNAGDEIESKEGGECIIAADNIPSGHKIALRRIYRSTPIIKYGQNIGTATTDIEPGEHVHVHNVESNRGRIDVGREEAP